MQANTQQTIPTAHAGGPAHRPLEIVAAVTGHAGEVSPIVGDLAGKGPVAIVSILAYRLGKIEVVKNVCHFIPVPCAVRIGLMFRLGNVVKPVAPARLSYPLLRLHHHVAESGERHIAADFAPQRFIAFDAGIQQFNQSETQAAFAAKLLNLSGDIDAKHRHHAGLIAV